MTSTSSPQDIVPFYESKTRAVLERYGPGPRVHYHVGLVDSAEPSNESAQSLRQKLVAAQERMLHYAAEIWRIRSIPFEDVLDVGCGLGGGAIFWSQEFGAHVTAITVAPSHLIWVARFAEQAGVKSRVQPLLCDALEVPGEGCFDVAIAVDSSSSFSRIGWFRRLAALLRPGGHAFVADCFLEQSAYEEAFNRHWCAQIGTIAEYTSAAREAGMRKELTDDISHRTVQFWTMTLALMQAEARVKKLSDSETVKFEESFAVHTMVRRGLAEGGLRYALMSFSKA